MSACVPTVSHFDRGIVDRFRGAVFSAPERSSLPLPGEEDCGVGLYEQALQKTSVRPLCMCPSQAEEEGPSWVTQPVRKRVV